MNTDPLRALVDVNVVLDVVARREPHYAASARVWAAIESGRARGLIAAHGVTTLHYLVARQLGAQPAVAVIADLLTVFEIATVDSGVLRAALALGWPDFEDAVQMTAASAAGADYVVTRNVAHFKPGILPVVTPDAFSALVVAAGE